MVGGAFGVAVLAAVYRGFQTMRLRADVAAAHLTPIQQTQADDAFQDTAQAKVLLEKLPTDIKLKVQEAVSDAFAAGIGDSLKVAALFALMALVAVLLLVPKGILHAGRED
jgi:hypothetical protein